MTLEDLGNLGDLIAGIAVVLSLIYLAWQIRQNTIQLQSNAQAARLAAVEASAQAGHHYRELFIKDPEVAALYLKGLDGQSGLSREERLRFAMLMQSFFFNLQALFVRFELYGLEPGYFRRQEELVRSLLRRPGAAEWWERNNRTYFRSEFVARVEAVLAASSGAHAAQQGAAADEPQRGPSGPG